MGFTSEKTLASVQILFDKFFDINALLDRQVYLLDIKWNLPKYQDYLHHNVAHLMPLLADDLQSFGSLRGDLFYRGKIDEHSENYENVSKLTERFVMELSAIEDLCKNAIKVASENGDIFYEDYLRDFSFNEIVPLMKQAIVFYNGITAYEAKGDLERWNKDFTSFIINKGGEL